MNQITRRRKLSNKQEQKATKELGLKMSPASGATMFGGGDGRLAGKIRLECKFTEADSYTLKLEDLLKLRKQAIKGGLEQPIFQLEFKGGAYKAKYAIVPDDQAGKLSGLCTDKKQITLHSDFLYRNSKPIELIFNEARAIGENMGWSFKLYDWNDYLSYRKRHGLDDRD